MKHSVMSVVMCLSVGCCASVASAQVTGGTAASTAAPMSTQAATATAANALENGPNADSVYLLERIERVLNDALGNEGGDESMPSAGRMSTAQEIAHSSKMRADKKATASGGSASKLLMDRYTVEEIRSEIVQLRTMLQPLAP